MEEHEADSGRMTPDEARAVVRLWSRRQWEREHWPTAGDVAEGLGISTEEAISLLEEVRTPPRQVAAPPKREGEEGVKMRAAPLQQSRVSRGKPSACHPPHPPVSGGQRLVAGGFLLTAFFCLALERLLA